MVDVATVAANTMHVRLTQVWQESGMVSACQRGCMYCCTVRVSVTIPELIRMVNYARANLSPEQLDSIKERARANAPLTHGTTNLGYPPRLPCAFLDMDGTCRVYAAWPLMCRREHALDATECKAAYDFAAPGKDYPIVRLISVKSASEAVLDAYHRGLAEARLDAQDYELQEAAHIAFSEPNAIAEWLRGQPAFASARLNKTFEEGQIVYAPELVASNREP